VKKDHGDGDDCSGLYKHAPEAFNHDIFKRVDGHILYHYEGKGLMLSGWRTTV
jgi:hypothetical protein